METNPLLIPADPFEAIINGALVQSAELEWSAVCSGLFMEILEIRYANRPLIHC